MQDLSNVSSPGFGNRPTNGRRYADRMPKNGKPQTNAPEIVSTLAANVNALLGYASEKEDLADRATITGLEAYMRRRRDEDPVGWGPDVVTKSTIDRISKGQTSAGIDVVAMIAKAYPELEVEPWQLLYPGYRPINPPIVTSSKKAQAMYRRIEESMRALRGTEVTREEDSVGSVGRDRDTASEAAGGRDVDGHRKSRGGKARRSAPRTKAKT